VLTDNDPYFCIDLDHAWDGTRWSQLAMDTLSRFPGAYIEVSHSGDGLHIIARGAPPEGYGTRGPGVELYTRARFIAITGTHAQGDPDTEHGAALAAWATMYLKPAGVAVPGALEWTTGPCEGATPIEDDNDLVRKMLTARPSAGVAFQGKASANQLWSGQVEPLADAFPTTTPGEPYDRSAADAALAAHLAFWTGRDCERIARLMRLSALVRPKWERDDYLRRTVSGACARVQRVYTGPQRDEAAPGVLAPVPSAPRTGYQFLDTTQMATYFAGCVHIVKGRRVLTPRGILTPEEFRDHYSRYEFQIDPAGGKPTKDAYEAFARNRATEFPWADATCFRPEHPPAAIVEENGRRLVNTYIPAHVTMGDGDVSLWLDLVARLLPDEGDRLILLSYLAAVVQHPGAKFQWAPLIQGVEGNGKSAILACMEYAVGAVYTHKPSAKELGDSGAKFTGWLANKLLILVEEIYVSDRREVSDALKPLITDRRVEIQAKGADQVTGDNRANFILTSNHRDAIIKTRNDRRYAVFYTAQQEHADLARTGLGGNYFPRLYAWLNRGGYADVAGWLSRFAIPDELNPATDCHRAPATSSTEDAIVESRGAVEQEILEAVNEERPGFCGGWISSIAVTRLLTDMRRTIAPRKRGALMASIGYVVHPALAKGHATVPIMQEDMKRPTLYVRADCLAYNFSDPTEATHNYMKAQGYGSVGLHNYKVTP